MVGYVREMTLRDSEDQLIRLEVKYHVRGRMWRMNLTAANLGKGWGSAHNSYRQAAVELMWKADVTVPTNEMVGAFEKMLREFPKKVQKEEQ